MLVFTVGGKPENPEIIPQSKVRSHNTLNPHEMASMGIEPGSQRWEARCYDVDLLNVLCQSFAQTNGYF